MKIEAFLEFSRSRIWSAVPTVRYLPLLETRPAYPMGSPGYSPGPRTWGGPAPPKCGKRKKRKKEKNEEERKEKERIDIDSLKL